MESLKLPVIGGGDSTQLIITLLPGLVTYLVVRILTSRERKIETADSLVKGLAYTVVIYAIWAIVVRVKIVAEIPDFLLVVLIAICLGVAIAVLLNSGLLYKSMRKLKLSDQSNFGSTWYSYLKSLHGSKHQYVQVHLTNDRILYGRIKEHSLNQTDGHIFMEECEWIESDGSLTNADGHILVPGSEIKLIHAVYCPDPIQFD